MFEWIFVTVQAYILRVELNESALVSSMSCIAMSAAGFKHAHMHIP